MRFIGFDEVAALFRGKKVAIVGSGPGCLDNEPGVVDSHDVVVRVNNWKTGVAQGERCDVAYAFWGTSIKKSAGELMTAGVTLCMCKLPDSQPIESEWHRRTGKLAGIDYRYIYRNRAGWWPCDVFVPDDARFLAKFDLLGKHQPTTGFAAILDVLACEPRSCFLTGFDFFASKVHNVNEPWREKNTDDPIRHRPDLESAWVKANAHFFTFDMRLSELMEKE
ncbi:MAG: hypothetical protein HYZ17_16340 [Betaproteobacteria bacterium]|nr:hypothetical protein [Betaproteobacteria bacterium]